MLKNKLAFATTACGLILVGVAAIARSQEGPVTDPFGNRVTSDASADITRILIFRLKSQPAEAVANTWNGRWGRGLFRSPRMLWETPS